MIQNIVLVLGLTDAGEGLQLAEAGRAAFGVRDKLIALVVRNDGRDLFLFAVEDRLVLVNI